MYVTPPNIVCIPGCQEAKRRGVVEHEASEAFANCTRIPRWAENCSNIVKTKCDHSKCAHELLGKSERT